MPETYKDVVLNRDLPESQLKAGDVAVLIDFISHPEGGEQGCILEMFNAVGESIAVVTVPVSAVQALQSDQVLAVRSIEKYDFRKR